MPDLRTLTGTYRLQLHEGFGFADAAAVVPYLADLGASHLYLSPVLQAAPGSTHGYDVVDHTRVSLALGGEGDLVALADRAHDQGLGVVVDLVPNHMALPTPAYLNAPLWQVLRLGREAPTAGWFDVDWDLCDGRVGLPVLGSPLADVLAAGELQLVERGADRVLCYHEQCFPVAPGTGDGSVAEVLARQHYLLADWRAKDDVLGYRRFFDVDTLVAVRVERADVFDATHALLVDLHRRGVVDGFRIDHPDGLADPEGYLERLAAATDGAWVVVEKILEGDERLPRSWATAGTTGYDAVKAVQSALVPPTGAELDATWRGVTGAEPDLHGTERTAKQLVLDALLQPELRRLVRRAGAATSLPAAELSDVLAALLVDVEVYRAYVRLDEPADAEAVARLDALAERASAERPDLEAAIGVVRRVLVDTSSDDPDVRDLVVRFQQVCGPVMAKGVEDTTFYRWHRFIALNEVGGDPLTLDDPSRDALHAWAAHQQERHPHGLTTLSTHDTKRGEDVRAQLLAAGEDVDGWRSTWEHVRRRAADLGVDQPTAYLTMQTVVGAWPISPDRLDGYLRKAVREAKQRTTWNDPDVDYEGRVLALGHALVEAGALSGPIGSWVGRLAPAVRAVTLAAKLVQLTLPGVPDVYQGCETVERFLVDPDNRRPVDYDTRRTRLAALDAGEDPRDLDDEKILLTSRALRLRRGRPDLFGAEASYRPLDTGTGHVLGFVRAEQVLTLVTRWPWTLARAGGWSTESVVLPDGRWRDLLGGALHAGGRRVECAQIFGALPVALLVEEHP